MKHKQSEGCVELACAQAHCEAAHRVTLCDTTMSCSGLYSSVYFKHAAVVRSTSVLLCKGHGSQ
jgi:hypothetical protein